MFNKLTRGVAAGGMVAVLLAQAVPAFAAAATVRVDPAQRDVPAAGQTTTLEVRVNTDTPSLGWQFGFTFDPAAPNHFRFRLGPEVEIALAAQVRANGDVPPGVGETVELFACRDRRGMIAAYDRLLSDAMAGDALLFARQDEVENAWRIVEPALASPPAVEAYETGTWGPAAAARLAEPYGGWHSPLASPC